ncbi:MAG: sodium:solute symporter family protein [Pseudomonadota bacterium]
MGTRSSAALGFAMDALSMPDLQQHWLAFAVLGVYGVWLVRNARVGADRVSGPEEYTVGGRSFGGFAIGMSYFATYASTNSYIGNAGKGYDYGVPWLVLPTAILLFTWLSWRVVAPRMRALSRVDGSLTLPEFFGHRFPSDSLVLRRLTAIVILVSSMLYLLAVFKGTGHLFQLFLGLSYTAAIALALLLVVAYTALGGFHSVVRTDVLQGVLMLVGSVVIGAGVLRAAGGPVAFDALRTEPATQHLFRWDAGAPFAVVLGIGIAGAMKLLVDPRQTSRFFALKDDHSTRLGMLIAAAGLGVILFSLVPVGLLAHRLLPPVTDTDLIVPTLLATDTYFAWWVRELLMVAILSAALSSLDSVLLVAASVAYRDVLEPLLTTRDERLAVRATRLCVLAFALLAAALALRPPAGIVELTTFSGSLYAACFLAPTLFGLYWSRGNANAAVAAMVSGIATLLIWRGAGLSAVLHEVFPALGVSLFSYCLWALRTSPARSSLSRSGSK